jgi:hypothetical protein
MAQRAARSLARLPAQRQGAAVRPDELLIGLELSPLPPACQPPRVVVGGGGQQAAAAAPQHGPFIFSAFMARDAAAAEARAPKVVLWVAGEVGQAQLRVRNVFGFGIELQDVVLETTDPCYEPYPQARRLAAGESKRRVVESPWSQFTSECQRFGHPPRLDKWPFGRQGSPSPSSSRACRARRGSCR